jgi:DNA-directed RNA polymerase specialized sigma24 family protein
LNHIEILAVLAAKTNADIVSDAKSTQSELKSGTSLQTKTTSAKIRRLRLITEIRHMVGNGRSYREIIDTLGIPERTFYRYLSQAYEHDKQLLMEQERDNLALELGILHDRLTSAVILIK